MMHGSTSKTESIPEQSQFSLEVLIMFLRCSLSQEIFSIILRRISQWEWVANPAICSRINLLLLNNRICLIQIQEIIPVFPFVNLNQIFLLLIRTILWVGEGTLICLPRIIRTIDNQAICLPIRIRIKIKFNKILLEICFLLGIPICFKAMPICRTRIINKEGICLRIRIINKEEEIFSLGIMEATICLPIIRWEISNKGICLLDNRIT